MSSSILDKLEFNELKTYWLSFKLSEKIFFRCLILLSIDSCIILFLSSSSKLSSISSIFNISLKYLTNMGHESLSC